MEIPIEFIAFVAIVLAIIGRTYFPYLKKTKHEIINFDYHFIITAIFSGVVTAIFIYPLFVFPQTTGSFEIFTAAFIFAWTSNDVVNRIVK